MPARRFFSQTECFRAYVRKIGLIDYCRARGWPTSVVRRAPTAVYGEPVSFHTARVDFCPSRLTGACPQCAHDRSSALAVEAPRRLGQQRIARTEPKRDGRSCSSLERVHRMNPKGARYDDLNRTETGRRRRTNRTRGHFQKCLYQIGEHGPPRRQRNLTMISNDNNGESFSGSRHGCLRVQAAQVEG
jgi:hypothetical protein